MIQIIRELIREMLNDSNLVKIEVEDFPIFVELASTPATRERGLSHRQNLAPDHGMLFCYEKPEVMSFWMRNTPIPLSIAFIGENGVIEQISDLEPNSEKSISSRSPCRWALETNRGWFTERGLQPGSRVRFS